MQILYLYIFEYLDFGLPVGHHVSEVKYVFTYLSNFVFEYLCCGSPVGQDGGPRQSSVATGPSKAEEDFYSLPLFR